MLDLWLVRHAESRGNLDGTGSDTDLTLAGEEQARRLGHALSSVGCDFDHVWTSPLLRARRTAAMVLPGAAPIVDARLSELEGSSDPTVVDPTNIDQILALLARPARVAESGQAFMARVRAWRDELPAAGRAIVFTHFGVVREVIATYLGFRRAPQKMGYASVFRLAIKGGSAMLFAWDEGR